MAVPTIEGRWTGFFMYGEPYPEKFRKLKVPFSLEIANQNGLITGICNDEFTTNMFKQPASIEGTAEKYSIMFIKKYPSLLTLDENEQPLVVPDEPSLDIEYTGTLQKKFFSNKYVLKGTWNISGSFLDENGNAYYYSNLGTWKLKPGN